MKTSETQKPAVYIDFIGDDPDYIRYVLYGIEEEGVSWRTRKSSHSQVVSAAYSAACDSPLGIGIAVKGNQKAALHHQKLSPNKPLYLIEYPSETVLRHIGANSARLAKRLPLKPMNTPQNACETVSFTKETETLDLSEEELVNLVTTVVKRVLKDTPPFV